MGELLALLVGLLHPAREPANAHTAVFAEYAGSGSWTAIALTTRIPRPIGYLMGLSGLAYLVQGWVVGTEGFSDTNSVPTLLGYALVFGWSIWLLVIAWRMRETVGAAPR